MKAKIIGICRHRIGRDGDGVTTLVCFHGCTLACKYCLNPMALCNSSVWEEYTPKQLYDETKIDDMYFRATCGGITFGGGEPCLQYKFIKEFKDVCAPEWKINIETALNVPKIHIQALIPIVNQWIVDIKDFDKTSIKNILVETMKL